MSGSCRRCSELDWELEVAHERIQELHEKVAELRQSLEEVVTIGVLVEPVRPAVRAEIPGQMSLLDPGPTPEQRAIHATKVAVFDSIWRGVR